MEADSRGGHWEGQSQGPAEGTEEDTSLCSPPCLREGPWLQTWTPAGSVPSPPSSSWEEGLLSGAQLPFESLPSRRDESEWLYIAVWMQNQCPQITVEKDMQMRATKASFRFDFHRHLAGPRNFTQLL